jgi:hypothetical protein
MGSMQACVVLMFAAVLVCGTWEGDYPIDFCDIP